MNTSRNFLIAEKIKQLILETILEQDGEDGDDQQILSPPPNPPEEKKEDYESDEFLENFNDDEKRYIKALTKFANLEAGEQDRIDKLLPGVRKISKYFKENLGTIGLDSEHEDALANLIKKCISKKQALAIPESLVENFALLEKFNDQIFNIKGGKRLDMFVISNRDADIEGRKQIKELIEDMKPEEIIDNIKKNRDFQLLEGEPKDLIDENINKAQELLDAFGISTKSQSSLEGKQFSQTQIRTFTNKMLGVIISLVKYTDYTFGKLEANIKDKNDYKKINSIYQKYVKEMGFDKTLEAINDRLSSSTRVITPQTYVKENRKNINTLANMADIFFDCANLETQMGMGQTDEEGNTVGGTIRLGDVFDLKVDGNGDGTTNVIGIIDGVLPLLFDNPSSASKDKLKKLNSLKQQLNNGDYKEVPQLEDILADYIKNPKTQEATVKKLEVLKTREEKTARMDVARKQIRNFDPTAFTKLKPKQIIQRIFFEKEEPEDEGNNTNNTEEEGGE